MTKSELTTFGDNLPHIAEPIANSGDKVAIPTGTNNSTDTSSSIKYGHPHRMSVPLGADGGVPVPREDMNGIYYLLSQITHYLMAGGKIPWSQAEASAIGGYPKDVEVLYNNAIYKSLEDSNTAIPTDTTKWYKIEFLPTSGGTLIGTIVAGVSHPITHLLDGTYIQFSAGATSADSQAPAIYVYDTNHVTLGGVVGIRASKGETSKILYIRPNGRLDFDGKNIVRSVNGVNADANGNVEAYKVVSSYPANPVANTLYFVYS